MKKLLVVILILSACPIYGQEWTSFNERKMDTVMFNVMNSYLDYMDKSPVIWSLVVQEIIMSSNYNVIKSHPNWDLHSLHNDEWPSKDGLPENIKKEIINENINPIFLESQKYSYIIDKEGNTKEDYGTFDYGEILVSIPITKFETYQEIANHAIHSWNNSPSHSGIMNANYNKKVIVGTITFYHKSSQRVFISFVYIS